MAVEEDVSGTKFMRGVLTWTGLARLALLSLTGLIGATRERSPSAWEVHGHCPPPHIGKGGSRLSLLQTEYSLTFLMYPLEESCACYQEQHPHTILYEILSRQESGYLNNKLNQSTAKHNCHCEPRKIVCLKDPNATCQVASSVLVKTICFLRSLPSFRQLPSADQSSLLRHCWVPLFVLGLAQDKIAFEVTDVPNSSILRQILLGPGPTEKEAERPTLAGVHKLKTCLRHLWNLELSPKEYAYLKGALLFNPAVQGLSALSFVEGLQQEAHRALREVIHLPHPEDTVRFSRLLQAALSLQTVSHSLVSELFFKPVIGNTNMLHLLTDMLFVQ